MSEIKDLYSPELDNTHLGMYYIIYINSQGYFEQLSKLIETYVPEVHEKFVEQNIDCQLFAVQWLTTFLARAFDMYLNIN